MNDLNASFPPSYRVSCGVPHLGHPADLHLLELILVPFVHSDGPNE
jgi:hypothetical protein